jgi:VanZ family protein
MDHRITDAPTGAYSWLTWLLAAATVGYTLVLVFATHYPNPQALVGRNPPSDKILHLAAYGVLGFLVTATLGAAGRSSARTLLTTGAALAVFGVLDEATQPLPWFRRHADPLDWVFDCAGIAGGIVAGATILAVVRSLARLLARQ